jgi:hypothetical protein
LLGRTHPGQPVVILTGRATEEKRKACLESGAAMFLGKLITPDGFSTVFAALDSLAKAQPQEGFRGMMRRVGLQEVLQMECLGRKSSLLEVFTGKVRGRIFISDGQIVHAESGALHGEAALYGLLGLRGGEFNLLPFTEPTRRTIAGPYEFLLMEAARLSDEGTSFFDLETSAAASEEAGVGEATAPGPGPGASKAPDRVSIEEVVLCSGAGELLYESGSKSVEGRLRLLAQVEQQAAQLSSLLPTGRFDRFETLTSSGRVVCRVQPNMLLFVSSAKSGVPSS